MERLGIDIFEDNKEEVEVKTPPVKMVRVKR
jgi:hypothetical protein